MLNLQIIKQSPIFRGLSDKFLHEVINSGYSKNFKPSDIIFLQDDPAQTLYLVVEGRLKLVQTNENGEEVILRYIGPGDITAAASVISGSPYPATAEAVNDGTALCWDYKTLRDLMRTYPEIALNALEIVITRLNEIQTRFLELKSEHLEQRIARTLLRLMKRGGKKVSAGILIDFPLSRQDIAEFSGTTLYSVSRTLSSWEKQGWVKTSREKIIVSDSHALISISENLQS